MENFADIFDEEYCEKLNEIRAETEKKIKQYISVNIDGFDKYFLTAEDIEEIKKQKYNKIMHEYTDRNSIFDHEQFEQKFYEIKYSVAIG